MTSLLIVTFCCGVSWLPGQAPSSDNGTTSAVSEAERIARLQRAIQRDQKDLEELKRQLADPTGEYARAAKQFQALDDRRAELRRKKEEAERAGQRTEASRWQKEYDALETDWRAARDRFNLALQERRLLQQKIANVQQELERLRQHLQRLLDPPSADTTTPTPAPAQAAAPANSSQNKPASPNAVSPAELRASPPTAPALVPPATTAPPTEHSTWPPVVPRTRGTTRLDMLQEEVRRCQAAAEEAQQRAHSLNEYSQGLRHSLELEEKLLEAARKRLAQAEKDRAYFQQELAQRQQAGTPAAELLPLHQKIAEAEQRLNQAQADVAASTDRLQDLHDRLALIQARQAAVQQEVQEKEAAAQRARERLQALENPFSPPNLLDWTLHHGPRILLIVLGMWLLNRLIRAAGRRLVHFVAQHGHRGSPEENEARAQTLVSVFRNAASLALGVGGTLMLLDEVGVPIMPLLGGAAVVGLAVAFGAQNLIRDYFAGFMVLLEDQYGLNDVVKIGNISGTVEKITLRITVLRDLNGVVHFLPHGTISTVSNLTHGWSQALFDVPVAACEDVDRVMQILVELGRELRRDPAFAPLILDGPEMLGVDELSDGKVILRFFLKTRPLKQWLVKREMLRRIKQRFDQLGIHSPFSPAALPAPAQAA